MALWLGFALSSAKKRRKKEAFLPNFTHTFSIDGFQGGGNR